MSENTNLAEAFPFQVPYPRSWIDRFTDWIEALPGPTWLFYAAGTAFFVFFVAVLFWIDGSLPLGTVDPLQTASGIFIVYWLGAYHYLSRVGSRALQTFRPLLSTDDSEIARLDYKLSMLPRSLGLLAVPMGYAFSVVSILGNPAPYGDLVPRTALPYIADILVTGFMVSTFFCVLIRSIRQLRMVGRLHTEATNINLLKLEPTHAFSALTARTGIGLILVLIIAYIFDPSTIVGTAFDILTFVITSSLAIAIFVLPVMGIRKQLEEEKQRIVDEASDRLTIATERLNSKIDQGNYDELEGIETAIGALIRERELFEKISTWPWDPKTIRGFASTLLLPIIIWLVTRLLERFL